MDFVAYTLNERLVVREHDECLFDARKFRIYKFNSTGYKMLSDFLMGGQPLEIFVSRFKATDDVKNFLIRCIECEVLIPAPATIRLLPD